MGVELHINNGHALFVLAVYEFLTSGPCPPPTLCMYFYCWIEVYVQGSVNSQNCLFHNANKSLKIDMGLGRQYGIAARMVDQGHLGSKCHSDMKLIWSLWTSYYLSAELISLGYCEMKGYELFK